MKFWQSTAFSAPGQHVPLAQAAEDAGMYGVAMSDHVFFPQQLRTPYPYTPDGKPIWEPPTPWPDVWVTIGAMSAVTTRLQFGTNVYIAPARDPFTVAKAVGTAAVLSEGRVSLGVGVGWMKEEFEATGQDFHTRGARMDEMIELLRTLWSPGWREHHGRFYHVDPLMMAPAPERVPPIWCGGDSEAALSRAARLCDGWIGNPYYYDDAKRHVSRLFELREKAGRASEPFEIIIGVLDPPSIDTYRRLEDLGVTGVVCVPWMTPDADFSRDVADVQGTTSLEQKKEALRRFSDRYISKLT
jgi:probable F420-dependent oxidoreductase